MARPSARRRGRPREGADNRGICREFILANLIIIITHEIVQKRLLGEGVEQKSTSAKLLDEINNKE